jgi:hypothetical protein
MMMVFVRASVWMEPRCDSVVAVTSAFRSSARVAEGRHHTQLAGERLLVRQLAALGLFVGQDGQRRDAHDGPVHRIASGWRAG